MTDGLGCIRVFGADRSGAPHGVRAYPHFLPTVWAHFPVTAGECALFSMHTHRKKEKMCHFLAPAGQPEMMHENFMHWHLCIFVVRMLMHEVLYPETELTGKSPAVILCV